MCDLNETDALQRRFTANNTTEMKYRAESLESYEAKFMAFSTVPHLSESGTTIKVCILRIMVFMDSIASIC